MTRPKKCSSRTTLGGDPLTCDKPQGHTELHISAQENWIIGWERWGKVTKYRWQRIRFHKRADTGLKDKFGKPIREGDILEEHYNEWYGNVRIGVCWAPEKGAWVSRGDFESGAAHESLNGEHFKECKLVGNVDEHPERLYPHRKVTA